MMLQSRGILEHYFRHHSGPQFQFRTLFAFDAFDSYYENGYCAKMAKKTDKNHGCTHLQTKNNYEINDQGRRSKKDCQTRKLLRAY